MRFLTLSRCAVSVTLLALLVRVAPAQPVPEDSPIGDALKKAAAAADAIVAVPDGKRTWENTPGALDDLIVHLQLDTQMPIFMANVSTDAAERERGNVAEEQFNAWALELQKREDLYKAIKAFAETKPKLSPEQQRFIDHTLRDFRRAGVELKPEKREQLKNFELEENKLALEFDKDVRDDETRVPLTAAELPGVPADVLARVPKSGDIFLCGLDAPTYMAIMTYCTDETTRAKMYVEYKRKGGKHNVDVLEKMLVLRAQEAQLLGYANTAEYATETRMVKNAKTVRDFYAKLQPIIRKKALVDFEEYKAAKQKITGKPDVTVEAWDQFFLDNWLLKNKYAVDSEKVQEYFPMDRVVAGLFAATQQLYGLEYRDVTEQARKAGRPFWHESVKLYEVWDKAQNKLMGEFYMDPYPRDNKYGHFAVFGLYPRKVWADGKVQTPVVAMVCNFPPPTEGKPSLMTHEDVETFFHEFGHVLHNLLTETTIGAFSGASTTLDFVELPSQMFENWVWNAEVLNTFAKHYKTGEPIPADLLKAMIAARNVSSGVKEERQVFYGMVDLDYHSSVDGKMDTTKVGMDLMKQCELFPPVPQTYFQAGFTHLTGYHAGYYGYLWSKVYAQDVATKFEEGGMLNPEVGMKWRECVLSRGGSVEEMDMLKCFLGREPRMEPFLKHLGLSEK